MLKELAKYIISLIIAFVFAEVVSYVVLKSMGLDTFYSRKPSGYFISDNAPGANITAYEAVSNHKYLPAKDLQIDKYGYLSDKKFSVPKPDSTLRIVIQGGSTAWGSGATYSPSHKSKYFYGTYAFQSSIAGCLEKMLSDSLKNFNVEVINAAVVEHTICQHHTKFITKDCYLQPDYLVTIAGYNDLGSFTTGAFCADAEEKLDDYIKLEASKMATTFPFTISLINRLRIKYSAFDNHTFNNKTPAEDAETQHLLANTKPLLNLLSSYTTSVQSYRVQHIFCVQPLLSRRDLQKPLTPYEEELVNVWKNDFTDGPIMEHFSKIAIHAMDSVVNSNGGSFIDLQQAIARTGKNDDVYTDYCHLTYLGNYVCAQEIFKTIYQKTRR